MKVLHATPSIGPARGGSSEAALNLCRGLAMSGIDVTLAASDDNGVERLDVPLMQPLQQDGVTVMYFARTLREYTFTASMAGWLRRTIADYDLVHIHGVFSYVTILAAWLAQRAQVPYVITPHGILMPWGVNARRTRLKQLSIRLIERRILDGAALIHATTAHEADALEALGPTAPIEVLPLGLTIPSPPLAQPHPHLGDVVMLFMGRLHPVKGLDLLLPALAQALNTMPHLSLVIAGEGDAAYTAWLRSEVARLGITDRVNWSGFLQGAAKWQALADSDMVIAPSYSESFGMTVAEAMMAGRPVIVTTGVALHRDVVQAGAGLAVPCEVEPLATAILKLGANPYLRTEMGQQGLRLAHQNFAIEAVTDRLLHLYQKTLRP